METEREVTECDLSKGLALVRRRRWYLWGAIIVYLPAIKLTTMLTSSMQVVIVVVGIWFFLALTLAFIAAMARCPRCGNYFHMHGLSLLFMRKCLHCELHLCADRQ